MLDIDINFLIFLLNPNYEYIKDDIKTIQKSYLKAAKDSELIKKEDNFNSVKYLLLTKIDDLNTFLINFNLKIIEDIYIKFGNFLRINLEGELTDNNFISSILLENNIKKVSDDVDLKIFTTNIYEYLLSIAKNSDNLKDKNLAKDALIYMEELLSKKMKIDSIIIPKLNLAKEKLQKRNEMRDNFIRKIIREHSYLLSEESRKEVDENNCFDYLKLLEKEDIFKLFFEFVIDDKNDDYVVLKSKNTISDIEKLYEYIFEDNFVYISGENTYKGQSIYIKLIQDINRYNKLYKNLINDFKYTKTKEEILVNTKELLLKEQVNNIEYKVNFLEDMLFDKNICNCFDCSINAIILTPLTWIKFNKKNSDKLLCEFYYTLVHELGHVYDLNKDNLEHKNNIFKNNCYRMLYEIYNEYRAINKTNELINDDNFIKKNIIHHEGLTIYQIYFCFFIDFIYKYEKEFLDYIKNDDITILENLIGKDNLEKLLVIIEEFDYKKFNKDINYANKIFSLFNEYLDIKEDAYSCMVKKLVKE